MFQKNDYKFSPALFIFRFCNTTMNTFATLVLVTIFVLLPNTFTAISYKALVCSGLSIGTFDDGHYTVKGERL